MPRQLQPTKAESKAALDAQAPTQPPKRGKGIRQTEETSPALPKMRSLADAGIDGSLVPYLKIAQLFADDEAEVSEPFIMLSARLVPNTLRPGTMNVDFTIEVKSEKTGQMDKFKISMGQDDLRMAYVTYFTTNTIPLGWLELQKLPPTKPGMNPYYSIHEVPADSVPF